MTNESTTDGNLNAKSTAYQPVIRYGHADRTDCSAFLALLPADHPLAISTYTLTLIGKILCYAWWLSPLIWFGDMPDCYHLGTDYFCSGRLCMGMYLMRQAAGDGLPAFMSFIVV